MVPPPTACRRVLRKLRNMVFAVASLANGPTVPAVPPTLPGVFVVRLSSLSPRRLNAETNELSAFWMALVSAPTVSVWVSSRADWPTRLMATLSIAFVTVLLALTTERPSTVSRAFLPTV